MIVIIDDVLNEFELETTKKQFTSNTKSNWVEINLNLVSKIDSAFSKILSNVNKYFDLSSMVGCEVWSHTTTRPEWHFDKDEDFYNKTGKFKFPICSIVFYPHIENLTGGRLMTGSEQILPKTNRLVAFSSGILHTVEPFSGDRISIAINPWNYKLC